MATKKHSRKIIITVAGVIVIAGLTYAFWPKPMLVDIGRVELGNMMVTINEEARTQVREAYIVSAPIAGKLLRVDVEPGDSVLKDHTAVVRMLPASPPALDRREQEKAIATVAAARASLVATKANLQNAVADKNLAQTRITRTTEQRDIGTVSQANFEQVQQEFESAQAAYLMANAEVDLRDAELANAQASLISLDETEDSTANPVVVNAPVNGRVLQILQESESVVAAGTPVLEIGNTENDLEVIVELLSTDAVQIKLGDRVILDNWGGEEALSGVVRRIDPLAFTKVSALGVEEQRVNAIVAFTNQGSAGISLLGHGYRIEVKIVIWENDEAIIVPSNALFRRDGQWAVFLVENGAATIRNVTIDHNNGSQASVTQGLQPDDFVVLYPASELEDGAEVASR